MSTKAKYLENKDKRYCCSCRSCEKICPTNAIEMEDDLGISYPYVNEEKCINCGKCKSVCQYSAEHFRYKSNIENKVYASWHKDENIVKTSSSGGLFTALSDFILKKDGVVFGASYNNNFKVSISSTIKNNRDNFKGSKYTKSDTANSYKEVKELLDSDKSVLYTGTPCQIAGLNAFLKKDYDKLICVDLICHGMPSTLLIDKYLEHLEKQYQSKVSSVNFRFKKYNKIPYLKIDFLNNEAHEEDFNVKDKYGHIFLSHLAMMPSCNNCLYNKITRESDITIGDFWGIEKMNPSHANSNGTSLVIVNTQKGARVFDDMKHDIIFFEETQNHALEANPPLSRQCGYNPLSKSFLPYLKKHGFKKAYFKYVKIGNKLILPYRVLRKIKKSLYTKED